MSVISVNNVTFRYKSHRVLANIYARIPESKIYGLLGPSGAGKTTLLKLILGRIKVQSGSIRVLGGQCGQNNRQIGYMPQDCALCLQLTVNQTLLYFANLYHISKNKYKDRIKDLGLRIGLPDGHKLVGQLSGGQQRQLSLCLALLNHPRLLILDEPTVGTDPELGDKIWRYLHACCAHEGMSVLLVTHYTEEAHYAHNVGFMRDGRLIEEGVPKLLLEKFQEKSLENVFLRLCKYQEKHTISDDLNHSLHYYDLDKSGKDDDEGTTFAGVDILGKFSLLWVLMILIRRNINKYLQYKLIFLLVFSPAFQTLLMCIIYGVNSVPIKTAIFNAETDPILSQKLLNSVKQIDLYYIKPQQYSSEQLAIESVAKGYSTGAIIIGENFSAAMEERVFDSENIDNQTIEESRLRVYIDNTNYLYAQFLVDSLTQTVWHLISDILVDGGKRRIPPPIQVVETIYAPDSKLSDFLLPGYMIAFIYLSQVTLSSILLIQERQDGLFDRAIVAGAGHKLVFASHFLTGCLMSFVNVILMLFIAFIWFNITNYGSYVLVVSLVMVQSANAIALGLLISSVCKESFVAFFISLFITLSQLFTSGAIFPNESIEPEIRKFLYYSPIAMPTESLRNVMLRGWGLDNFYVFHGFAMNLISGLLFTIIAIVMFKRNS